jgi:hypothetical protein
MCVLGQVCFAPQPNSAGEQRKGHSEAERFGVPHFLATQYLGTKGIKPQFPNGIVSSVSFVSTTDTARSLAGCVLLALALMWRSPGSSEKLCPASHDDVDGLSSTAS